MHSYQTSQPAATKNLGCWDFGSYAFLRVVFHALCDILSSLHEMMTSLESSIHLIHHFLLGTGSSGHLSLASASSVL